MSLGGPAAAVNQCFANANVRTLKNLRTSTHAAVLLSTFQLENFARRSYSHGINYQGVLDGSSARWSAVVNHGMIGVLA